MGVKPLLKLGKLEAARRQLETAIKLYFENGNDVSIHTLTAASYSLLRDINEHASGTPMLKDLHKLLSDDLAREFKRYINRPENFLKHADQDPVDVGELEPQWTEVLLWEARRKYCEITGDINKVLLTFVLWFVAQHPEVREQVESECISQGYSIEVLTSLFQQAGSDRRKFFQLLN